MILAVVTSVVYLLVTTVSAQSNCGVPDVVRNLKTHHTTNTSTLVSWEHPASSECLDHYRISSCSYLNDAGVQCAFKSFILPLNTTQFEVTGLEPCRNALIEVFSIAPDGKENYTYVIFKTGSGDAPKLEKVTVSYVDAKFFVVDWDLPGGYNKQCYPGFRVCYSAKGESEETCSETSYKSFRTPNEPSLSPCTEYNISVVTVDGSFYTDSKPSPKTYASVVTAPMMPKVDIEVRNHTAHLTWETPDSRSLSCAASYNVTNCRYTMALFSTDCETKFSESLPLNATEATVTGIDACATKYISVNLVGQNGYSSNYDLPILDKVTEIPAPSDANVTYVWSNIFTVDFYKGSNDCVDSYRACWITKNEHETCAYTKRTWGENFNFRRFVPCSNYTLHFAAIGTDGRSSKNITLFFQTGPTHAPNQTLELSPHSALLSWDVASSALQCGSHYDLTWAAELIDTPRQYVTLPVNATSYNMTSLASCAEYSFTFSTAGIDGTTSGEKTTKFTTPLGEIGPITNFRFYYFTSDMVLMDTDFPYNSEECVRTYDTCWYETGGSQEDKQCGERVTGWNVNTLLKACVNFTITVNATTNDNRTMFGSTTFTPGPTQVVNLTVDENSTAHTAILAWINPPTNHLCAEYIQVTTTRIEDNKVTTVKLSNEATSTLVTDLSPCTSYLLEVKPVASFIESGSDYLARYTTSCGNAVSNLQTIT